MDAITSKINKGSKPKHKTYSIEEIASVRSRNDYILAPLNNCAAKPKTFSQIKHEKRKKEIELLQTKSNPCSLLKQQPVDDVYPSQQTFTGQARLCPHPTLPPKSSNNLPDPNASKFDYSSSQHILQRRSSIVVKDASITQCPNCGYQANWPLQTSHPHNKLVGARSLPTLDPDALPSKLTLDREPYLDICGGRLTLTPDSCIDALSCMCGVKFLLYHCLAPPDDENLGGDSSWDGSSDSSVCSSDDYQYNNTDPSFNSPNTLSTRRYSNNKKIEAPDIYLDPCSCSGSGSNARYKLFMRWSGLLLMSVLCPCLCLYPPLKALSRVLRRKKTAKKELKDPPNVVKVEQRRHNTQKQCFECPKCSHGILIDSNSKITNNN